MRGVHERPERRLPQPERQQPAQHPALLSRRCRPAAPLAGDDEHRASARFLQSPQAGEQMIVGGDPVEAMQIDHRIERAAACLEPPQLAPRQLRAGCGRTLG